MGYVYVLGQPYTCSKPLKSSLDGQVHCNRLMQPRQCTAEFTISVTLPPSDPMNEQGVNTQIFWVCSVGPELQGGPAGHTNARMVTLGGKGYSRFSSLGCTANHFTHAAL